MQHTIGWLTVRASFAVNGSEENTERDWGIEKLSSQPQCPKRLFVRRNLKRNDMKMTSETKKLKRHGTLKRG